MKAARFYGVKDIRVEEVPETEPGPQEVKIKIAWNGICGTDLHEYLQGPIVTPSKPHPTTGEKIPVTFGHEFSGTIAALGKDVDEKAYAIGTGVVVEPILDCGRTDCAVCTRGLRNLCERFGCIGLSGGGGGLSTYVTVHTRYVHVIPENIPLEIAACIEPLAVAWHAVLRANFEPGDRCLIVGGGPIGLFVLKVLKSFGCTWVAVSEPAKARREKALKVGADLALDPLSTDVVSEVKAKTLGLGVDIAFECAGVDASLACAVAATKPRGTIVDIALWEKHPTVNMMNLLLGEKVIKGSSCYVDVHKDVIRAISSGSISGIEDLITKKISIDDVVLQGFESLVNDKENQIKILVHP